MDACLRRRWEVTGGFGAILASLVHGVVTPAHFAEWWGYGYFFLVATAAQAILGLALVLDAFERASDRRIVAIVGLIGTLSLIALYVVTRTLGVPLAGPALGEVEGIDGAGVAAVAAELVTAVALARLLR